MRGLRALLVLTTQMLQRVLPNHGSLRTDAFGWGYTAAITNVSNHVRNVVILACSLSVALQPQPTLQA